MFKSGNSTPGFTLAELLIALAILGVIASFTIPKILTAQQDQKRMAVFKETLSTMSQVAYSFCKDNNTGNVSWYNYVASNVNAIKLCPTNGQTEGCNGTSNVGAVTNPAVVLASGAVIGGLHNSIYNGGETYFIDWNGASGNNVTGDDQIEMSFLTTCSGTWHGSRAWTTAGDTSDATSVTFYQTIFAQ